MRKALVVSKTRPLLQFLPRVEVGLSNKTRRVLVCKCVCACVVQEGFEPSLREHLEQLFILPVRRAFCHFWLWSFPSGCVRTESPAEI